MGKQLPVPLRASVTLLGLVLEDRDLLTLRMALDLALDAGALDERCADLHFLSIGDQQDIFEDNRLADFKRHSVYLNKASLLRKILPTTVFDDCVFHSVLFSFHSTEHYKGRQNAMSTFVRPWTRCTFPRHKRSVHDPQKFATSGDRCVR